MQLDEEARPAPGASLSLARDRVFQTVMARGPVSAAAVATALGITPAAVRRHLDSLVADGLVAARDPRPAAGRGRGRPARAFVVTGRGQRAAVPGYEDAAVALLDHLENDYGHEAVERFADERARRLEQRWRPAVDAAGEDPLDRARALSDALSADGFAAGVRDVPTGGTAVPGVQLCQGHCPVHALAESHPDLCEAETRAFSRLVGVHVQRLATIAHGDHVCTTFIPEYVPEHAPQQSPQHVPESVPDSRPPALHRKESTHDHRS